MTMKDLPALLTYAFATASVPLFFVENPYFRRFVELLSGGDFQMPHRTALTSKLKAEAKKIDENIKRLITVSFI